MRTCLSAILVALIVICVPAGHQALAAGGPTVTVGLLLDGQWENNEKSIVMLATEVKDLLSDEYDIRFPAGKIINGNWDAAQIKSGLDRLLADPEVDIVIAGGYMASSDAGLRGVRSFPKPVLAPLVINSGYQGFPYKDGTSGVKNFSYLTFRNNLERDLEVFSEITPFKKVSFIMYEGTFSAYPRLKEIVCAKTSALGYTPRIVLIDDTAASALAQLDGSEEAVVVSFTQHMPPEQWRLLVDGLNKLGLPTYSLMGSEQVKGGLLATRYQELDLQRLARRIALNLQSILQGQDAGSLPVEFSDQDNLLINLATARQVGVDLSWVIKSEAELIDSEPVGTEHITLSGAVFDALDYNLALSAQKRSVEASSREVNIARSNLLPRLEIQSTGTVVDKKTAQSSFGQQPQRLLTGSATLTQLLYSEPAWANLDIQQKLQKAREKDRDAFRLDVIQLTTTTYLNVLRAESAVRIQRDNLRLTRRNLDMARKRLQIGYAGPQEVYRWESQLANNRKDIIAAQWQLKKAKAALNLMRNQPLEKEFIADETSLEDTHFGVSDPRLENYISSEGRYTILRDFLVQEGIRENPAIQKIDLARQAQRRALSSAKASFWAPTVSLQFQGSSRLAEDGLGTEGLKFELPPGMDMDFDIPSPPDDKWHAALNFSLPLFEGGRKLAERSKAALELESLRIQNRALSERVEQEIRTALFATGSSYPAISLSRDAAEAARKNLEIVTESYSRGTVSILELLDAQNFDLVAEQVAASSVFDFMIDMVNVERAVGKFWFMRSLQNKESMLEKLEQFAREYQPGE